jgi:hypothetical protein
MLITRWELNERGAPSGNPVKQGNNISPHSHEPGNGKESGRNTDAKTIARVMGAYYLAFF